MNLTALTLATGLALTLTLPAQAADDAPLLTVEGPQEVLTYDLAALEAMEARQFDTTTIWTSGSSTFQGVPLRLLLDEAGITEGSVVATAINDYAIEIPVDEVGEDYPIVAYRMDGATMSVRDKGPLWLVYPYDSDAAFRSETVYSRSIWQLDRLSIPQ